MADIFQTAFDEICTQLDDVDDPDIVEAVFTPPTGDPVTVTGHFSNEPDFQPGGMSTEYIEHNQVLEVNIGEFTVIPVPGWTVTISGDSYDVTNVESDHHHLEVTLR